jgi:hypothetical protein
MRVTSVELFTDDQPILSLGFSRPESSDKYQIKAMVGLDADEIIRKFYAFGAGTNRKFYNLKLTKRDLVLRIVLNPNYSIDESVSDVRDRIYAAISANRSSVVDVFFNSGGSAAGKLSGFITKLEVPHFSKEPELQITISCEDPMIRGHAPTVLKPAQLSNTNPVLIADSISNAPHGLSMNVEFTAVTTAFTIQSEASSPEWSFTVTPLTPFQIGDILHLSSEFASKNLYVDDGSSITYLMDRISPGSIWPTIFPGNNEFHFSQIANFDWIDVTHYAAFWGV